MTEKKIIMITFKQYITEQQANAITVDIPLFLRLLEYSREDAKQDIDLHFVAENIVRLQKNRQVLTMADYDKIVKI